MTDDDLLLVGNGLDITTVSKLQDKQGLENELASLYLQKPNTNVLGIPREWLYLRHADPQDTGWYDNWARDRVGEPPTLLDTVATAQTAGAMQKYLRNKKGFYEATVKTAVNVKGYKAKVDYIIDAGQRYLIDSVFYIGYDKAMLDIIESMRPQSLVDRGDPADATLFDLEKNRIVVNLQNMGYADFVSNYLEVMGDSTGGDHEIDIFMEVISPLPDSIHRQYTVGDIHVYTDHYKGQLSSNTDTTRYNGKVYRHELRKFLVRPQIIDNSIYLEKGDILTRRNRTSTYRRLSDLSTYRFVSLNPLPSPIIPYAIDYDIHLTPHQNKWINDRNLDVYYSNFTQRERQLIGVGASTSFTNRNLLGGSERYKVSGEGSVEFDPVNLLINRYNVSIDNSLQIPRLVDYAGIFRFLNRRDLLTDNNYQKLQREAKTNLRLGFNRNGVVDFYGISIFNASAQYLYTINKNAQVNFSPSAFSLNNYSEFINFKEIVGDNPLIINSFADNLITGYLFSHGSFIYNSNKSSKGYSWSFTGDLEVSGWETYLANQAYNVISDTDDKWQFLDRFEFSQFAKIELDWRFYKDISSKQQLAARFSLGVGSAFGNSEAIPFIKQFSVGGPNSLRAWDQKELGPGSYDSLLISPIVIDGRPQLFYQSGDFLLEANLEYRFDLFWILEGALFTDVGNVWTLKEDPDRPGSGISTQFYDDLAVAAGWGLRFDFSYFIIRFDFGYRLRNPYPDRVTGKHWNPKPFSPNRLGNLQVAVNYPF